MTAFSGVQEYSYEEMLQKEAAAADVPNAVLSVVRSQIDESYSLVEYPSADQEREFAYAVDAMNHLLALLHFPDKLRGFLSCILGMSKNGSEPFEATNWQMGLRSRTGRASCSNESMERWVIRQKEKLEAWMQSKNFHFVKITPGDWNELTERRDPTRYQVFFNKFVVQTVVEAKRLYYWNARQHQDKFRGRALREAARKVLLSIPEAPPLKQAKITVLSEEEKFDRRHNSTITFMEKNRDFLDRLGIAPEEYFFFLIKELDKIAFGQPGLEGKLVTPDKDLPQKQQSIIKKLKNGTLLAEPEELADGMERAAKADFDEQLQNFTGETVSEAPNPAESGEVLNTTENANSLNPLTDDRVTFLSGVGDKTEIVKHDGVTEMSAPESELDMNKSVGEVQIILKGWVKQIQEKLPPATTKAKFDGAWDIAWNSVTSHAQQSEHALNFTVLKVAKKDLPIDALKQSFLDYIMIRLQRWSNGVPQSVSETKLQEFRQRLDDYLKVPDV